MNVLCVIPARAGSVRVPLKNIQALGESTLVGEAVACAQACPLIDTVAVSSDNLTIFDAVLEKKPLWVSRPKDLSTGYRDSLRDVVAHALANAEAQTKKHFDLVVTLQPATPLRSPRIIAAMIDGMHLAGCQSALTGVPIVPWTWRAQGADAENDWSPNPYPLSQDCPGLRWQEINSIQIATRGLVIAKQRWSPPMLLCLLPAWAACDIDTPADLREAQRVYPDLKRMLDAWIPSGHLHRINSVNKRTDYGKTLPISENQLDAIKAEAFQSMNQIISGDPS